jgi:glutamyl-tRNA reductase
MTTKIKEKVYMALLTCGINHETAELALRERMFISSEQLPLFLTKLLSQQGVFEAVVLSTCNRTEIYAEAAHHPILLKTLADFCRVDFERLSSASYQYVAQDMVRHLMRVACGLDSMVLGEPQILGQLKEAMNVAELNSALGPQLFPLFQQVFAVAKRVRTHTEVGVCPMSVASTAVSLAKDLFPDLSQTKVLLIGAGDTVALTAKHLQKHGATQMMIASRHLEKAQALADQYQATPLYLKDLADYLWKADIVFTATASTVPILGKGAVETALKKRGDRPLLMIDIAVPRDIEPEVAELKNVYLYTIDDLKQVIQVNLINRQHAAQKAEEMIVDATQHYMNLIKAENSIHTLRAFRLWAEELKEQELIKANKLLRQNMDPEEVLRRMANALSNKLMHPPTVKIREAGYEGRTEFVECVHELFDLDA